MSTTSNMLGEELGPSFQLIEEGSELTLNMGPHHPSTHGVLRFILKTDGEVVRRCIPDVGFLHRSIEKIGEKCTYEWKIRDGKGCETKKGGSAALTPVPQPSVEAKAVPVKAAAKVTRQLIQPVVFQSFTVSDR